jgi:hypothetical protein
MTGAATPRGASTAPTSAPAYKVATATPKPAVARPPSTEPKSIDAVLARSKLIEAPTGGGGPVVQIGAYSSAALSNQGYADVSRLMVGQMGGKAKHMMTIDHGGATLFRTWVSGFATRAEANAFCAALKAHGKPCFVKG